MISRIRRGVVEPIEFQAEIIKVQQLQNDLAIRVTLDLPESMIMVMAQLAECKRAGALLRIKADPYLPDQPQTAGRFDQ